MNRLLCLAIPAIVMSTQASAARVDLNGDWECIRNCGCGGVSQQNFDTTIDQEGDDLTFTNECGLTSEGTLVGPSTVELDQWEMRARVSPDQRYVHFSNGSVWKRVGASGYGAGGENPEE